MTTKEQPARKEIYPDYLAKLAAKREAMKDYHLYIEHCKRVYPGGSESAGS